MFIDVDIGNTCKRLQLYNGKSKKLRDIHIWLEISKVSPHKRIVVILTALSNLSNNCN